MKATLFLLLVFTISSTAKIDVDFGSISGDFIDIADSMVIVDDSTITLGGICITTPGRDTICWSTEDVVTDFRINHCQGFMIDDRNDPLGPGAILADSVGWIFNINTTTGYDAFGAWVEFGPNRRVERDNSQEIWAVLLKDTTATIATGLLPGFFGHKIIEIYRNSSRVMFYGPVDVDDDLTAGTIEADNGADATNFVVAVGDTITVVGGVITKLVHP